MKPQVQLVISPKVIRSIAALFMYLSVVIIILSFFSEGILLNAINRMVTTLFGWGTIILITSFFFAGNMLLKPLWKISRPTLLLGSIIIMVTSISLTQSGSIGQEFWASLAALISGLGAFVVFITGILIGLMVFFEVSLGDVISWFGSLGRIFVFRRDEEFALDGELPNKELDTKEPDWQEEPLIKPEDHTAGTPVQAEKQTPSSPHTADMPHSQVPPVPGATNHVWRLPPIALLSPGGGAKADRGDIKANAQTIEKTLDSFGVQAKVIDYSPGPTVTQYAIRLATGTKLTKVTSLANDLALALAARTGQIRIEAPIPGRPLVGIEVPNVSSSIVTLRQLLLSPQMKENRSKLLVGLGLDVGGNHIMMDIGKMPHLLIAGQTGSGKSVCINVLMMSILFRASPSEVRFILVDPKRVELTAYNNIPHLLTPVIVEPEKVVSALKWAIVEMENRYKLFAEVGARNLEAYNEMAGFQAMPYIVVVIDEMADIMLYAPSEVEDCINRLAQMARATGIHLVLATQRPSVDVITGLIKANIPARIAFSVSSMMDSRVILDSPGAEKLLGKGDMLFIPPDQAKPRRIQGAYVTDADIKQVTEFLKNNGVPVQYTEEITTKYKGKTGKGGTTDEGGEDEVDEMFEESVRIICGYDRASASLLQRKLSIGYNRAARIIDQLYAAGVISEPDGAKPREVLIKNAEEFLARRAQGA